MPQQSQMSYDASVDAVAISFHPRPAGTPVTQELTPQIRADFIGDTLVGFEILGASALMPKAALARLGAPGEMLTLAEAAKESKRQAQTIRKAIAAGKIVGAEKRGRDWLVPRAALWNYLEQLGPAGRPPKSKRAPHARRRAASA